MNIQPIHPLLFFCKMLTSSPLTTLRQARKLPAYISDLKTLSLQQQQSSIPFALGKPYPCLKDKKAQSGIARGHYFHTDLYIAQCISQNKPETHIDVGSRIDGFVAHVASFRKIHVIDIRPLKNTISNIEFIQTDIMSPVPEELHNSCDSLSCLHALEHFGLGRYGDPVMYDGYLEGFHNMTHILKPGGKLYLAVPIGPQRIEFNAHRVFSVKYLLSMIEIHYTVEQFSFVDDSGQLHRDTALDKKKIKENYGCWYGCGIFEIKKTSTH